MKSVMKKDGLHPLQIDSGSLSMNAAGISVSSRKSIVAVLYPFGEVVRVLFEISHSAEELALS